MKASTAKRCLLWALILFSVGSLVFAPFDTLKEDAVKALPWVGAGIVATEGLFIAGLAIMAVAMGVQVRNPFRLRGGIENILLATATTRLFWCGFWMNALGALGSSVVIGASIFVVLPPTSWGLAALAIADLATTIAIRIWAWRAHKR